LEPERRESTLSNSLLILLYFSQVESYIYKIGVLEPLEKYWTAHINLVNRT